MVQRKVQRDFVDHGFGFPVRLRNVPMVNLRGHWTPDIDFRVLARAVLGALSIKPARLTGDEVRFIRLHHGMTLEEFASEFSVSHPAVMKWEKSGDRPTRMNWSTEKDVRLWLCVKLGGKEADSRLATVYRALVHEIATRIQSLSESTTFACRKGGIFAAAS